MRNIKLTLEYDGTNFNGWQTQTPRLRSRNPAQRKFRTIQEEIQKVLKKIFKKKVTLIGSGRTDSGVHALGQVANFRVNTVMPLEKIKKGKYGICEKCGKEIPLERLEVSPEARFCLKCEK